MLSYLIAFVQIPFRVGHKPMRRIRTPISLEEVFCKIFQVKLWAKQVIDGILMDPEFEQFIKDIKISEVFVRKVAPKQGQIPLKHSLVYAVNIVSSTLEFPAHFILYYKYSSNFQDEIPLAVAIFPQIIGGIILPQNYSAIIHDKLLKYLSSKSAKTDVEAFSIIKAILEGKVGLPWIFSLKDKQEFEQTAKFFPFIRYFLMTRYNLFDSLTINADLPVMGYIVEKTSAWFNSKLEIIYRGAAGPWESKVPVPASDWITFSHELIHSFLLYVDPMILKKHIEKFHPNLYFEYDDVNEVFAILWEVFVSKQIIDPKISLSEKSYLSSNITLREFLRKETGHPVFYEPYSKSHTMYMLDEDLLVADVDLFIELGLLDDFFIATNFDPKLKPTDILTNEYFEWIKRQCIDRGF